MSKMSIQDVVCMRPTVCSTHNMRFWRLRITVMRKTSQNGARRKQKQFELIIYVE